MNSHAKFDKIIPPVLAFAETACKPYNDHFYIKNFDRRTHGDETVLPVGNTGITAPNVATAVHSLTRWIISRSSAKDAFKLAYNAAVLAEYEDDANEHIRVLDATPWRLNTDTVKAAVKLSAYEKVCQHGTSRFKGVGHINPTTEQLKQIADLVNRAKRFFLSQNVVETQIVFDSKGTKENLKGVVSYLSPDTLWELKVSKKEHLSSADKIALIVYLIMLRHEQRSTATKIGFYQVSIDQSCVFDINTLDKKVYDDIERLIYG